MPNGEPAGSIPNVGLFAVPIKGKLIQRPVFATEATQSDNSHVPCAPLSPGQVAFVTS